MQTAELILVLLAVSAAMGALAYRLAIPHPVLLVLGGAVLPFIPHIPRLTLDPEAIFILFVPPLLYRTAATTSLRDFRARLGPIAFLSIVMVLATMGAVAAVSHALIPGFSWAAAFALGAVVAPTDSVAALAVTRRLRVPRSIVTVLSGEALVNDAASLVAYRMAIAAAMTGAFSLRQATVQFVVAGLGGALLGIAIGKIVVAIRRRLNDMPTIDSTVSLLTPFAAYIPAEQLGWSGVLAVVAVGFYIGKWLPSNTSSATRLQSDPMWDTIVFILEALVFIVVGLELPDVLQALQGRPINVASGYALAVTGAAIGVRLVLVFPRAWLTAAFDRLRGDGRARSSWRHTLLVGWSGMRGGDSLVLALALPFMLRDGSPFPGRDLIIFLTCSVIVGTLIVQGLSLRFVASKLRLQDDGSAEREERAARARMAHAALSELDKLAASEHFSAGERSQLAEVYARRARVHEEGSDALSTIRYSDARLEMIEAERKTLLRMRDDGEIGDEVMRRVMRDLDFETSLVERMRLLGAMTETPTAA